jgi:hypothetical protein
VEHLRPGELAVADLVEAEDRSVEALAGPIESPLAVARTTSVELLMSVLQF